MTHDPDRLRDFPSLAAFGDDLMRVAARRLTLPVPVFPATQSPTAGRRTGRAACESRRSWRGERASRTGRVRAPVPAARGRRGGRRAAVSWPR